MDFNKEYEKLGIRIKKLRENAGLTQEQLAVKSDLSLNYLGKIEVNINKPGLKTIFKLAKTLNLPVKELFNFD